jgi:RNA-binding protein Nova
MDNDIKPNAAQDNGNRKRKSDYSDSSNNRKRSNNDDGAHQNNGYSGNSNDLHLKMLVPSALAGSIIGRGGERISQLQKDTECRVKMSKANDFYPNTNERICLIIGSVKAVLKAHDIILERMQEKTEAARPHELDHPETRLAQIKLLIPKNTAGLIIGRSGAVIKTIKDESGAFVQISSKDTDQPERILTIEGELPKRLKAFEILAQKIKDDPLHSSCNTLSYSGSSGGGANDSSFNDNFQGSQGNGMMPPQQQQQQPQSMVNSASNNFNSAAYYLAGVNNLALLIINCGGSFQMTPEALKVFQFNTFKLITVVGI